MNIMRTAAVMGTAAIMLTACGSGDHKDSKEPNVNASTNNATTSSTPTTTHGATSTTKNNGESKTTKSTMLSTVTSTTAPPNTSTSGSVAPSGNIAAKNNSKNSSTASSTVQSDGTKKSNTSAATGPAKNTSTASSSSGSASKSSSSTPTPTATFAKISLTGKDEVGTNSCAMLPNTSTKSPSFTIKTVKTTVTKDNTTAVFTFSKDYTSKLFTDEASWSKAQEYGFRIINSGGDNLIYSFKSGKAFKLTAQGNGVGKQSEVPSVKVEQDGKNMKVTIPQKDFGVNAKSWGAEEYFYGGTEHLLLSSCEKRSS